MVKIEAFVSYCASESYCGKKYKAHILKQVPCILKYMACIFCDKPCVFSGVAKRRAKKTIFYRIKQCGMTFLPCGGMLHG